MKFEIDHVTIIYPNEDSGTERKIEIENNSELLQLHFIDKRDLKPGGMTLTKTQVELLRDTLNLILKNRNNINVLNLISEMFKIFERKHLKL